MWNKRTVYLESLGCAKNQVDAELMLSVLAEAGWQIVDDSANAELVLVNTCGFIRPAKEEAIQVSLQAVGGAPQARVIMTGCLSQRFGEAIEGDLAELSGFFGNRRPQDILEFVEKRIPQGERVWRPHSINHAVLDNKSVQAVDKVSTPFVMPRRSVLLGFGATAFVKVAEGCRNRCTFCAIPLIRGDLRSRTLHSVVEEVRELLERGVKEIVLIAQDLNAFGMDRSKGRGELAELLRHILLIPGKHWIRPLYVYPDTFDLDMLALFESDERLLPYFDIPFQHGSREVLRAMARSGDAASYLELISAIRNRLPHAAIRTSILVGFPGETEANFQELLAFQKAASLEWLGVFSYSPEEGTFAATMKGKVSQKDSRFRQATVEGAQIALSAGRLERYVGMTTEVLVEELVADEEMAIGRTFFQAPEVDGLTVVHGQRASLVPGTFVKVKLMKLNGVDMEAILVKE